MLTCSCHRSLGSVLLTCVRPGRRSFNSLTFRFVYLFPARQHGIGGWSRRLDAFEPGRPRIAAGQDPLRKIGTRDGCADGASESSRDVQTRRRRQTGSEGHGSRSRRTSSIDARRDRMHRASVRVRRRACMHRCKGLNGARADGGLAHRWGDGGGPHRMAEAMDLLRTSPPHG